MGAAFLGQKTTLSCEINGNVGYGIRWMRPNNGTPEFIIGCSIPNSKCSLYYNVTGYSVAINQATQQQTLTIDSFNSTFDVGIWSCTDGVHGAGQTTCIKVVSSTASLIMGPVSLVTLVTVAERLIRVRPAFL